MIFRLLKRDLPFLSVIAIIFAAGILLGRQLSEVNPQMAELIIKEISDKFAAMLRQMADIPVWGQVLAIFINNFFAVFLVFWSGLIIFPFIPMILCFSNGVPVGLFEKIVVAREGIEPLRYYLALLPHGILELPAFFMAVHLGVRFSMLPYRILFSKGTINPASEYRYFFTESSRYFLLIITMLIMAAIIEITVSPLLLKI